MHDSAYRNVEVLALVGRGTGRQASLMWSNLAGFWGVGMPVCYLMAFKYRLGVEGLWIGLLTGLSCSGQQFLNSSMPGWPQLRSSIPRIRSSHTSWFFASWDLVYLLFTPQTSCPATLA